MKPSEAINAGRCPSCLGEGTVHKVILDSEGECNTCEGSGVWPPPSAWVRDERHSDAVTLLFGDTVAHGERCARVKSQRRMMNERRAARADRRGPLFADKVDLLAFMDQRDPCTCGGIDLEGQPLTPADPP